MSIFNTLQTAVSGMAAQANRIGTIGDNIANSSTTGYKDADTEFETLLGNQSTSDYVSGGVQTRVRYATTTQGDITASSTVTNLAISGNGFFSVQTANGASELTRAGAFVADNKGNLVNTAGDTLMGYNLTDGSYNASTGSGTLEAVNVSTASLSANPSTTGTLAVNLPSTATAVDGSILPSSDSAGATYTEKSSLVAYDNLGTAVNLDVYMTKTGDNTWEATVYNAANAASGGGFPYSTGPLNTQTLTFDGSTGKLASGSASALSIAVPNGNTISLDMSNSTQLAADYSVTTGTIDGNAPSKVSSVTIGKDGTVSAVYASGATAATFKIPLANVASPANLTQLSDNNFQVSEDSGNVTLGLAQSGSLGEIDSSSLESSTVDLATQLTELIATQRSYEANSKVLTTGSDMLSTIIQSIRQ